MHPAFSRPRGATAMALLGTASFLTIAGTAVAQPQAQEPVEEVLVTGSLIHGAAAVGIPVTALSDQDFHETGAITIADMMKSVPAVTVQISNAVTSGGGSIEKGQNVQIHGLGTGSGVETLMMVNGYRYPVQGHGVCLVDPSIIPQLAVDHLDVLADGSSATYGSDAVAGVLNVILKRGYDGAQTIAQYTTSTDIGGATYKGSQLYGRKWDGGDIAATYEWYHNVNIHGLQRPYFTANFEPYGFNDVTSIGDANPAVVSVGGFTSVANTNGFTFASGTRFCANCFSIPSGTGWNYGDSPAHTNPTTPTPTTTWSTVLANPGVQHLLNPYRDSDLEPTQDRSAAVLTFDQDLFKGVNIGGFSFGGSLFVDGFYSNRRSVQYYAPGASPGNQNILVGPSNKTGQPVPTTNPYYPAGAPAGLRIAYDFGPEHSVRVMGGDLAGRYDFGLNLDLPSNWTGTVYYSRSTDKEYTHDTGMMNTNMISAALGNTVPAVAAAGIVPGQAAFTKPANIPYLNVFCDATAFQCNSPITEAYIDAYRFYDEHWDLAQSGFNFDGPIFDLPAGSVKAALGYSYTTDHFNYIQTQNFNQANTSIVNINPDPERRAVGAAFGQLNIPLVGEANAVPLVQALNVEISYRYDRYEFPFTKGVKTPKVAGTWDVGYGLSLRGTWGKSFRAPGYSESSAIAGVMIQPANPLAGAGSISVKLDCQNSGILGGAPSGVALPLSLQAYINPGCNTSNPALVNPGGLTVSGGAGGALAIRPAGYTLNPEQAKNWSLGFEFKPTDFLAGFDANVTYYNIHIDGLIAGQPTGPGGAYDPLSKICTTPTSGCSYIVKANPNAPITDPANALFLALVTTEVGSPKSTTDISAIPNIQFIQDTATTNVGHKDLTGIDFDARYDWDLGDWGAWNVGATGTYGLTSKQQANPSVPVVDLDNSGSTTFANHDTGGNLKYRARVGWEKEGFSIAGFVNFRPHSSVSTTGTRVPPACYWATGFSAGSCYPGSPYVGPYDVFPSLSPGTYLFDLALGYQTGDMPANSYLKNLNFQFTVLNLFNRAPPFLYNVQTSSGYPRAFDTNYTELQRVISFSIAKVW